MTYLKFMKLVVLTYKEKLLLLQDCDDENYDMKLKNNPN
jgi:hypothetical protein